MNKTVRSKGFSLLEVIVAMAILATCVTALMQVFTGSTIATGISSGYYNALEIAESRLAALVIERNPLGIDSGETQDGYQWRTTVAAYQPDMDNPLFGGSPFTDLESNYVPYYFHVEVEWASPRTRYLELSTVHLGVRE